ncbi:hypothetical protein CQ018_01580 [Arthrobacter sp. MYb227]|uniref:phosphotransferase n=1 Tax=Arthrobacter sp. MYb227 TaxID=1848601 RepID=UPI000CFD99C3|nr:phosphotransferase [Arthrobacter sp. MYb227]PQZ96004.1 hypothetical protein CQ018_01580 [Arthrobacter sp. MYb227]
MSTASQHASHESLTHRDAAALVALLPAIPRLVTLLGGHAATGPWNYEEHRIRLQHRPGAGISALYRMPAGTGFTELGLSTEKISSAHTAAVQIYPHLPSQPHPKTTSVDELTNVETNEPVTVSGWIHPFDPMLPALATAMDGPSVSKYWGHGEILKQLSTVAYRPLRRAVMRATFVSRGPLQVERNVFLKVGRAEASEALLARHRLMDSSNIPVPSVLNPEPRSPVLPGIVALTQAPGEGLSVLLRRAAENNHLPTAVIETRKPTPGIPTPEQFIALLDELPESIMELPPRPAWSDGLDRYVRAATLALPRHSERIGALHKRLQVLLASSDRGGLVPTHGDFYVANILLKDGKISALLDLDSLGPGYRVDDLACFLGHLAILPTIGEKNQSAVKALENFGEVFERAIDPVALWARSGAVALTLIAGARSADPSWVEAAEARLRVAEELVDRADHEVF